MSFSFLELLTSSPAPGLIAGALALLKMTIVLLTALALTHVMRRASAGARHLVWLVALASVLVIPALAFWAPLSLRVLPAPAPAPISMRVTAPPAIDAPASIAPITPSPATGIATPAPARPIDVGLWLVAIWLTGALLLLARLAVDTWAIRRVVRSARAIDRPEWRQPLLEIADRLGLDEAPRVVLSDRVKIPFAAGFSCATIVLPLESEGWSRERRSAVLVHELGHVRRRDLVGHTVGRMVCALYWFHPLVWSAARRLRIESERACDDLALVLGARPSEYAEHLLDIVSGVRGRGAPAAALAMATRNEFEGRMLAILDPRIRRRGLGRAQALALALSLAVVAIGLGVVSLVPRASATQPGTSPAGRDDSAVVMPSETRDPVVAQAESDAPAAEDREPPAPREQVDEPEVNADADASDGGSSSEEKANSNRVRVLVKSLRDDDTPEIRRLAAWGLQRFASAEAAAEALTQSVMSDESEEVREMAAWALSGSRMTSNVMTALYATFRREKSAEVRRSAAWAAGSIGDRTAVPGLVGLLADKDPAIREVAAWSIGSCSPEKAPAALVRLLSDPSPNVRLSVAWALHTIGDESAADALESAFQREQDPEVRRGLIRALGSMGDRTVETLTRLVSSSDPETRAVAIAALAGGNAMGPWPWPRPEPRPYP